MTFECKGPGDYPYLKRLILTNEPSKQPYVALDSLTTKRFYLNLGTNQHGLCPFL